MKLLRDPVVLTLAFAIAALIVVGWWYGRKHKRSHPDEMPTIPAPEIAVPSRSAADAPIRLKKHTTQEILKRALRRGDKALGTNIEDSSLPFLDTSPLTHRDQKAEVNTAGGEQTARNAPSDRQNQIRGS